MSKIYQKVLYAKLDGDKSPEYCPEKTPEKVPEKYPEDVGGKPSNENQ